MSRSLRLKLLILAGTCGTFTTPALAQVYQTYGVHNPPDASPCETKDCEYPRKPGEPPNPIWPAMWQATWTMYRVHGPDYAKYPPPYADKPPAGATYQVSHGATFYDSTWRGASGSGAMMESYDEFCLPIFPLQNNYSCKFISLGNIAYFVAGKGRPSWMPPVCLFSRMNHPPRPDFIKHLPYSPQDSERIGPGGQGYSFWVSAEDGKIMQVGTTPDQTANGGILFGYGFKANAKGEVMPHSFYFSGYPLPPASAPYVSQNYRTFNATQPSPELWAEVAGLYPGSLPACQLFNPPKQANGLLGEGETTRAPTWSDIGRWRR